MRLYANTIRVNNSFSKLPLTGSHCFVVKLAKVSAGHDGTQKFLNLKSPLEHWVQLFMQSTQNFPERGYQPGSQVFWHPTSNLK